jgi:thiol:disulfide interchange protein
MYLSLNIFSSVGERNLYMPKNLDQIVLTVLALWMVIVCVRIFWATQLRSFMLIGLSIIFFLLTISINSQAADKLLKIISQFLFWCGVLWLGTFERQKLNEFRHMSLKEYSSRKEPKAQSAGDASISIFENHLFLSLSVVLIAVATINYYFLQVRFLENLPLLITALLFITYSVGRKRG